MLYQVGKIRQTPMFSRRNRGYCAKGPSCPALTSRAGGSGRISLHVRRASTVTASSVSHAASHCDCGPIYDPKSATKLIKEVSVRLRVLSSLLLLFFSAYLLVAQAQSSAQKFSPPTRTFRFTYNFTVKDIPSGAKRVRVWVPVAQTDRHQTVRVLDVKAPVRTRMTQETEYGNRMMYVEIQDSVQSKAKIT